MNWQAGIFIANAVLAFAGLANFFVLQSIKVEISMLKAWALEKFAEREDTHERLLRLEGRL